MRCGWEGYAMNIKQSLELAAQNPRTTPEVQQLLRDAAGEIGRLDALANGLLNHCGDPECFTCGELVCPHGEPMHFHHDGCPVCAAIAQQDKKE